MYKKVQDYFNKSFHFVGNELWYLPLEAYKSPPWQLDTLQQMKVELNAVKSQLSNFDLEEWSTHTRKRDPASSIIQTLKSKGNIELLTQAWCKFYECLNQYPVVPEVAICSGTLHSLHLCEAPGAFVSALNRFLYTNHRHVEWRWAASTLNPYYEGNSSSDMIADDRLIRHTAENWNFGLDLTGDLMKFYNHEILVQEGPFALVTADGSVDCMKDPGEQENHVHFLHYCEVMTAIRVLDTGGTLVLKLFTTFEHGTTCLLYLLNCIFLKVHIFKPCSSKSGNSEVYVICLGYKGQDFVAPLWPSLWKPYKEGLQSSAMFSLHEMNRDFLKQLENCASFFKELQSFTINENVRHFQNDEAVESDQEELKGAIAEWFVKKYRVAFHIPKRRRLMQSYHRPKFRVWDLKCIPSEELEFDESFLAVKVGKAIATVLKSNFCQVDFTALRMPNIEEIDPLPSPYVKLTVPFQNTHHLRYQSDFYTSAADILEDSLENLLIVGSPVLTRFLVGVVYILATGFGSVVVYRKGAILLQNLSRERLGRVKKYLSVVSSVLSTTSSEKRFACDVLEVMPQNILESGEFYEAICTYNNGLFESQQGDNCK